MRDAHERVEPPGEDADANMEAGPAATPDPKPAAAFPPARDSVEKAGAGRALTNETARLVCAVSVAVALGVGCGLWINARLASAASAFTPIQNHLLPEAPAEVRAADAPPTPEPTPAELHDDSSAPADAPAEAATSHGPEEAAGAGSPGAGPAGAVDKDGRETRGAGKTASSASSAFEADETSRPGRIAGRAGGASAVKSRAEAAGSQGSEAPCTPYTSAGALNIRSGGAAAVVIGGPGRQGRVTVATPNWSDIVVLSEGPTGGGRGWMKYSVRSISNRAGVYAVHVRTPCGAQTIPVTVGRP